MIQSVGTVAKFEYLDEYDLIDDSFNSFFFLAVVDMFKPKKQIYLSKFPNLFHYVYALRLIFDICVENCSIKGERIKYEPSNLWRL